VFVVFWCAVPFVFRTFLYACFRLVRRHGSGPRVAAVRRAVPRPRDPAPGGSSFLPPGLGQGQQAHGAGQLGSRQPGPGLLDDQPRGPEPQDRAVPVTDRLLRRRFTAGWSMSPDGSTSIRFEDNGAGQRWRQAFGTLQAL